MKVSARNLCPLLALQNELNTGSSCVYSTLVVCLLVEKLLQILMNWLEILTSPENKSLRKVQPKLELSEWGFCTNLSHEQNEDS